MGGAGTFNAPVQITGFPSAIVVLNDKSGHSWKFSVTTGGVLSLTSFSIPNCGVPSVLFAASNSTYWNVATSTAGAFVITAATQVPADPQLGTLYPPAAGYPKYSQPGGPGTPTIPQPQNGGNGMTWVNGIPFEVGSGMFTAGCNDWFNSWDIASCQIAGVTAALILCPVCHYLQQIIIPYLLIQDPIANPIIFG